MRLNIILNEQDKLDGYTNLHAKDLNQLDSIVSDNECVEFRAIDCINYINMNDFGKTIEHWARKIRHGGNLTVGTVELLEIAKSMYMGAIDLNMARHLLFGDGDRKSAYSIVELVSVMKSIGFKVIKKCSEKFRSVIVAERP